MGCCPAQVVEAAIDSRMGKMARSSPTFDVGQMEKWRERQERGVSTAEARRTSQAPVRWHDAGGGLSPALSTPRAD